MQLLQDAGWRVMTVWECCFKGKSAKDVGVAVD